GATSDGMPIDFGIGQDVKLDISSARLRVRRGADLLDLGFRFAGMKLRFGPNKRAALEAVGTAPVLKVDFPPQHVMERSFLRQELGLPDFGPPVTALEQRTLLRGGPRAAALRKDIYDRKVLAPDPDKPEDPDRRAFTTFADAWANEGGHP